MGTCKIKGWCDDLECVRGCKAEKMKRSVIEMKWFKKFVVRVWIEYWLGIILISFLILFFGKILHTGIGYSDHKDRFEIECKAKGGVMFVPRGVRGWPIVECRNPAAMIYIDV